MSIADAPELFRTVGDPNVMKFWASGPDKNPSSTEQRIAAMASHWQIHGFGDWGVVEKASGKLIGFCGLHYITDMVEVNIGYAIERTRWHQGFGLEASKAVLDFGFQELRLKVIVAVIRPNNRASIRLVEKLGLGFWKAFIWQGEDRVAYRIFRNERTSTDD